MTRLQAWTWNERHPPKLWTLVMRMQWQAGRRLMKELSEVLFSTRQ